MTSRRWQVSCLVIALLTATQLAGCATPSAQPPPATVTVTAPASVPPSAGTTTPEESPPAPEPTAAATSAEPGEEPSTEPSEEPSAEPTAEPSPEPTVLSPTPRPTISGTARYGHTLVADPGVWGPGEVTLSYRWYRSGAAISGAHDPSYQLAVADVGHRLQVRVTGSKPGFPSVSKYSSQTPVIAAAGLTSTPTPTINGTAQVGQALSVDTGTWGPGTVTLSYRWYRSGSPISGADDAGYTPVAADVDETIKVRVTGSKSGYTPVSRYSDETAAVIKGVLDSVVPHITGLAKVGHRIYAAPGDWGPAPVQFSYAWYKGLAPIAGAHDSSYLLTAADLGHQFRVRVTGSKDGYVNATRMSGASAHVIHGTFTSTPVPVLPHTIRVGQTLNAHVTWMPIPVALSYQWFRNGLAITSATSATYTVHAVDVGTALRVRVHGSKAGYTSQTRVSEASSPVHPGLLSPTPTPVVTGAIAVGFTLHTTPGTWGPAPVLLTYQWRRDGVNIVGATGPNRVITLGDRGHRLSVAVTGHRSGYAAITRVSAQTPVIP